MAQPQRKSTDNPDIRPDLHAIDGGGDTTPDRARLHAVETSQDLQKQEAGGNVIQGPWGSKSETDESDAVRDAEEKGDWATRFSDNLSGGFAKPNGKVNFKAVLKKRGPLAAILAVFIGGGVGVGIFFGPSLLLIQIQEAALAKFDTTTTTMTVRSDKILANKITGDSTTGSCNTIKIACKFSRPSNKLLTRLEANGVTAYKGVKTRYKNRTFPATKTRFLLLQG